jgi:hypothetical protein
MLAWMFTKIKKYLTSSENKLYYKSKQKGEQMITLIMLLFACGEEKTDDTAEATEQQEEQTVEDTATEPAEEPVEEPEEETQDTATEE